MDREFILFSRWEHLSLLDFMVNIASRWKIVTAAEGYWIVKWRASLERILLFSGRESFPLGS